PMSTLDDLSLGDGEWGLDPPWGKHAVGVVMVEAGQADLLEIVGATGAAGSLAHALHRRQEQPDQDGDEGDHHQELDQREGATQVRPSRLTLPGSRVRLECLTYAHFDQGEGTPAATVGVGVDAGHEMDPPRAKRPP